MAPPEIEEESALEGYLKNYINLDVNKYLGISFLDYMNLTIDSMSTIEKVLIKTLELTRKEEQKQESLFNKNLDNK